MLTNLGTCLALSTLTLAVSKTLTVGLKTLAPLLRLSLRGCKRLASASTLPSSAMTMVTVAGLEELPGCFEHSAMSLYTSTATGLRKCNLNRMKFNFQTRGATTSTSSNQSSWQPTSGCTLKFSQIPALSIRSWMQDQSPSMSKVKSLVPRASPTTSASKVTRVHY